MFDVGFVELLLIGVVALIVVGPERLPRLARTAGMWVGRARRAVSAVKEEIDRELRAEELKEIMRKQSESRPLERILDDSSPEASGKDRSSVAAARNDDAQQASASRRGHDESA